MSSGAEERWRRSRSTRQSERLCRRLARLVTSSEPAVRDLPAAGLADLTGALRARLAAGEDSFDLLFEAFAAVREAASRVLEVRAHDGQVMAGAAMAMGLIADLPDGEGKTLACVFPAYLASLTGKAVHVVAADDRRAGQAADATRPVYEMLGVSIGLLEPALDRDARRTVYAADVVYGSADQFGYDLLADEVAEPSDERVQRGLDVAIVDDAVEVFLRRADATLTLGAPPPQDAGTWTSTWAGRWSEVTDALVKNEGDYSADPEDRRVRLREPGIRKLQDVLGVDRLRPVQDAAVLERVARALEAREFGGHTPEPGDAPPAEMSIRDLLDEYEKPSGVSAGAGLRFEEFDREYGMEVVPAPPRPADDGQRGSDAAPQDRLPDDQPDDLPEDAEQQGLRNEVLDAHRKEMAARRRSLTEAPGRAIRDMLRELVEDTFQALPDPPDEDHVKAALGLIREVCPISGTADELMRLPGRAAITSAVLARADRALRRRADELGTETLGELARQALIDAFDRAWRDHLARAESLPSSLSLLGTGADDPQAAYEDALEESYVLMIDQVRRETLDAVFSPWPGLS